MHGLTQFTPQQLLESGRRAEADGKPDIAHQFYWHLADQYGYTAEAAEARSSLARLAAVAQSQNLWQAGSAGLPAVVAAPVRPASVHGRRGKAAEPRPNYRSGRALAALAAGSGWLAMVGGLAGAAFGAAAHFLPAPPEVKLTWNAFVQFASMAAGGAGLVLAGQAARALFDQAIAARDLVAIARATRKRDPP